VFVREHPDEVEVGERPVNATQHAVLAIRRYERHTRTTLPKP
jgi:hypothetical protein